MDSYSKWKAHIDYVISKLKIHFFVSKNIRDLLNQKIHECYIFLLFSQLLLLVLKYREGPLKLM